MFLLIAKKFIDYEFDREELFGNVRLQHFDKYEDTVNSKNTILTFPL